MTETPKKAETRKSLLEQALSMPTRKAPSKPVDDEAIELFWAFVRCRVTLATAAKACKTSGSGMYARFLDVLQHLVANKELQPGPMLADLDKDWGIE